MSNELAIATVTEALGQRVYHSMKDVVNGADVLFGRPVPPAKVGEHHAYVYLYQTTPNAALRNRDLPTRGSTQQLVQQPQAAIDLHYLISFYGNELTHEPDRMLAATVRELHAHPVLTDQDIADAVAARIELTGSDLASAPERVRFTPLTLSLDDLSRLWSVMVQTPYALSLVYSASVVLLDGPETAAPAPPVLQRGKGDPGPEATAALLPSLDALRVEFIASVGRQPPLPSLRAAQLGTRLTITGRHLGGDGVTLSFKHPRLPNPLDVVIAATDRNDTQLRLTLQDDAMAQAAWAAGLYSVVARVERGGATTLTPTWPMLLAPRITLLTPTPVARANGEVTLQVACIPRVLESQEVTLLLVGREIAASPRQGASDTVEFVVTDAPVVEDQLVWIRVDGVESLPVSLNANTGVFEFDSAQRVTIT